MPNYVSVKDFVGNLQRRLREIDMQQRQFEATGAFDDQEMAERQEATEALLGESEGHFVSYVEENVRTSADNNDEVRRIQQECWKVYNEDPPPNYADKESWQSKVIVPKPHGAVKFAMAAVKQAFQPKFLSVEDKRHPKIAAFWRKLLEIQLDREHGKFVTRFTTASGMGFAVGQSFEMIPIWRPGRGLDFSEVEPWKIHRDTDALSMAPWSGLFWVHEEWQDLWYLQQGEQQGRYVHTTGMKGTGHEENNPQNWRMDRQQLAELRQQYWNRNTYRTSVLTREFWGTMLDKRGNLLHPRLTYTVAGNRVITLPRESPYPTLRWPGVSFSPLPNFLRFDGRSLLQSVRSLWYFMCNLQALHNDYLNWHVNPMLEITRTALVDPDDIDRWPGKVWETRETVSGQQVVRTIDHKFTTNEVLANAQFADSSFRDGTFITTALQGLPGFRQEVTARESAQNLQQSLTVFSIMGENLDFGAVDVIRAVIETIQLNITQDELLDMFDMEELLDIFGPSDVVSGWPACFVLTPEQAMEQGLEEIQRSETGVLLPALTGTFHVSGLQSILKDFETMNAIERFVLPMMQDPMLQKFVLPHKVAHAVEVRSGLQDEGLFVEEEQAMQMIEQERQAQAQMIQMQQEAMQKQAELAEAQMVLDAQKLELDAQKLANDAHKVEIEAQIAVLEFERAQAEANGQVATMQAELQQQMLEMLRTKAEIAKIDHGIQTSLVKTVTDLQKAEQGLAKTRLAMEHAERKMELQERVGAAQIQAAKRKPAERAA